jgi:hypothetical protein
MGGLVAEFYEAGLVDARLAHSNEPYNNFFMTLVCSEEQGRPSISVNLI